MDLLKFKEKKYGEGFVDIKMLTREFNENEKKKKKYFALKRAGKINSFDFLTLKKDIIW